MSNETPTDRDQQRTLEFREANSGETSPERLEQLADSSFASVRVEVASHQSTPLHVLVKLSNDQSNSVVDEVTCRDKTPAWLLLQILKTRKTILNGGVLKSPNITPEIVDEIINLSKDKPQVIKALAENPYLPTQYFTVFAKNANIAVRKAVAANLLTPTSVILELLNDPVKEVQLETISHPSITGEQLTVLIEAAKGENRFDLVLVGFVLGVLRNKNLTVAHIHHLTTVVELDKYMATLLIRAKACTDNMKVYLAFNFFGSYMKNHKFLKTSLPWKNLVVNYLKPLYPEVADTLPLVWLEHLLEDSVELLNPFNVPEASQMIEESAVNHVKL